MHQEEVKENLETEETKIGKGDEEKIVAEMTVEEMIVEEMTEVKVTAKEEMTVEEIDANTLQEMHVILILEEIILTLREI